MSLWTNGLLSVLLLQMVQLPAPEPKGELKPAVIEEAAAASDEPPPPLVFAHKNWELTQAYSDVFKILSAENSCSGFYGGPQKATTVLNDFVPLVKGYRLERESSFEMNGRPSLIYNPVRGVSYRLFDNVLVNTEGSFYKRRIDSQHRFPANVGEFAPGTRPARALILLHELGHLIRGADGSWLLTDDGHDGMQSNRNTLVVQHACRAELEALN